jgi:hypothetical protein
MVCWFGSEYSIDLKQCYQLHPIRSKLLRLPVLCVVVVNLGWEVGLEVSNHRVQEHLAAKSACWSQSGGKVQHIFLIRAGGWQLLIHILV